MGNPLTQEQLENAWDYLGNLFYAGSGESYKEGSAFTAWHVEGVDIMTLKEIFFYDVAPLCMSYPYIGYDAWGWGESHDEFIKDMKKKKRAIARSKIRFLFHELEVKYLRWRVKEMWDEFEDILIKYRSGDIYIIDGKVKYRDKSS